MEVDFATIASGIKPLELEEGDLIEAVVVLVKVSRGDGESSLQRAATAGMSHWEQLGMLIDAADGLRGGWED